MRKAVNCGMIALLLTGCGYVRMAGTYSIKSMVNEAVFYRARYIDNCVTTRTPNCPCADWAAAQRKLDSAADEANSALKVGGSEHLQLDNLRVQLNIVEERFSQWAISAK